MSGQELRHRGPDAAGTWSAGSVILNHTKLAIQDATRASDQPIEHGPYAIAFNGQIYNAPEIGRDIGFSRGPLRFDGDILGPAYDRFGDDLWRRLDGEFAIALYDRVRHRLVLVRDRIGARPLHYLQVGNTWFFASEAKAILARAPRRPSLNVDRACADLVFGAWAPRMQTYFEDVCSLPPGSCLTLTSGGQQLKSYWCAADVATASNSGDLETALDLSVGERLVGRPAKAVFLSGGVDSTTVASIASTHSPNELVAYSVRYPEGGTFDEFEQSATACRNLGIELRPVEVLGRDVSVETCDRIAFALEEPPTDLVFFAIWKHYATVSADGFRVVLTGQGNDELWCGYQNEEPLSFSIWDQGTPLRIAERFKQRLFRAGTARVGKTGSCFEAFWGGPWLTDFFERQRDLDHIEGHLRATLGDAPELAATRLAMGTALRRHLDQEDRLGMAYGIESRVPLLANRLIDLALVHQARGVAASGMEKATFRAAAERFVGPAVAWRPKRSYPSPARALAGELLTYVLDCWEEIRKRPLTGGLLNPKLSHDDARAILETSPDLAIRLACLDRFSQVWQF